MKPTGLVLYLLPPLAGTPSHNVKGASNQNQNYLERWLRRNFEFEQKHLLLQTSTRLNKHQHKLTHIWQHQNALLNPSLLTCHESS